MGQSHHDDASHEALVGRVPRSVVRLVAALVAVVRADDAAGPTHDGEADVVLCPMNHLALGVDNARAEHGRVLAIEDESRTRAGERAGRVNRQLERSRLAGGKARVRRHRRSARVRGHRGQIASNVLDRPASNGIVGVSRRRMNHGAERYRGGSPFSPSVATRQRRRDGMQLAHPCALPIHKQLHRRHIAVDLDGDVLAATLRVEIARVPRLQ